MVQVLEPKESIFGRVGGAIGKGLAEQIPKEVDRYRLSQGLDELSKNAPNRTALQNYTQALKIPGITPEVAANLERYINQTQSRKSQPIKGQPVAEKPSAIQETNIEPKIKPGQNGQNQPETKITINTPNEPSKTSEVKPGQSATLTKPSNISRGPRPNMTYAQQEQRAYEIAQSDPVRFPNGLVDALPIVQSELAASQAAWDANRNVRAVDQQLEKDYDLTFTNVLERGLQKKGNETFFSLPGEIQNTFKNIGLNKINNGETPEEAAVSTAKEAIEFAKRRDLLATYPTSIGKAPEETVKSLKQVRDDYAKYDALPIFVSDMKNTNNLGDHLASTIGYPLSSEVNKVIPAIDTIYKSANWEDNLSKKIADNLTNEDSLFTIGLDLHEKGYDDQKIMDKVISILENRRSSLTDNQKNEMGRYYGLDYTLGDIILSHLLEPFGEKGKISAKQKSRIYFWGKR